jgi:hypothetical protein
MLSPYFIFFLPFRSSTFLLAMAQAETSDPPTVSATPVPSPSQSQAKALATDATKVTEASTVQQRHSTLRSVEAPAESDNEVQFIFSAPRRRKKKRRR